MLALISLILVLVGCANWLTIGLLQFDFVAGLFGSQSNIFSRIVYVIIGVAAVILTVNIIKNKGRIAFNFKKLNMKHQPQLATQESSADFSKNEKTHTEPIKNSPSDSKFTNNQMNESSRDNYKNLSQQLSERRNYNKNINKK